MNLKSSTSPTFNQVMVDLETTGTQPEHAGIIQIAAVKFCFETEEVSPNFFDRKMWLAPHRYWDQGTAEWWSRQKCGLLDSILAAGEDPAVVMQDFADWVGYHANWLWAKPSHFEYPFLESYFRQYGIPNPFHFRSTIDLRSFIRGRANNYDVKDPEVEFVGDAHNALFDVLHQIKILFEAKR